MVAGRASLERDRRSFAATWRDSSAQVVATTWSGTMCWFPRRPGSLRIVGDDFEHIIRCGECPGCLELERLRLADRLVALYANRTAELWLARITAPQAQHAALSHNLHRRPALALEPGFFRLGSSSFAVLTRCKAAAGDALRRMGCKHKIEKVRLSRGRRAWRAITAGLTVAREVYGEQVKRWYVRGLPPADVKRWTVTKRAYEKGYSRLSSPRAWRSGNLMLVPPEVWRMRKVDRAALHRTMRLASTPELAAAMAQVLSTKVAPPPVIAAPKSGQMPRERQSDLLPPLSRVGGYGSSVHSSPDSPPEKVLSEEELLKPGESGDPRWMERERERLARQTAEKAAQVARTKGWIANWSERMEALVKKRE